MALGRVADMVDYQFVGNRECARHCNHARAEVTQTTGIYVFRGPSIRRLGNANWSYTES